MKPGASAARTAVTSVQRSPTSPLTDDVQVTKFTALATAQGDSLIIRNEAPDTFVELMGDAKIIYKLLPTEGKVPLGALKAWFKEQTGREVPMGPNLTVSKNGC